MAGAAHLLHDNTGVLRGAQGEQKSPVEHKGKSSFDSDFQYEYELRKHGLAILLFYQSSTREARGVRRVTKGITGLWQPRVHIDVAF